MERRSGVAASVAAAVAVEAVGAAWWSVLWSGRAGEWWVGWARRGGELLCVGVVRFGAVGLRGAVRCRSGLVGVELRRVWWCRSGVRTG